MSVPLLCNTRSRGGRGVLRGRFVAASGGRRVPPAASRAVLDPPSPVVASSAADVPLPPVSPWPASEARVLCGVFPAQLESTTKVNTMLDRMG